MLHPYIPFLCDFRFENVKAGEPFSVRGALSADYSLQFMIGMSAYQAWRQTQKQQAKEPDPKKRILLALPTRRVIFRPKPEDEDNELLEKLLEGISVEEEPRRAGPKFNWKPY